MGQECSKATVKGHQIVINSKFESYCEQIKAEIEQMKTKNNKIMMACQKYVSEDQKQQFQGYMLNGLKQGYGQLKYGDQKQYYGYFKNNLPHVKGVLIFSNSHYYIGQFNEGKMHGKGKQICPFFTFDGQFSFDNKKYGKFITDEFSYEGSFEEKGNLFGGCGELKFKNGQKYIGNFVEGEFHGSGLYFDSQNFLIYSGNWKNSLYHGFGKYYWTDGSFFEGNYRDGLKNGEGKYLKQGQDTIHGVWNQGSIIAKYKGQVNNKI